MVLGGSLWFFLVLGNFLVVLGGSWGFLVVLGDSWFLLVVFHVDYVINDERFEQLVRSNSFCFQKHLTYFAKKGQQFA